MTRADLDAALIAAVAGGDKPLISELYEQAAADATDWAASAFFLTHAYIYALDAGLPQAADLRQRLVEMNAER